MLVLQLKFYRSQQSSRGSSPHSVDTNRTTAQNNGAESAPTGATQSLYLNEPASDTNLAGSDSSTLPASGCATVAHGLLPPSPQQPQQPQHPNSHVPSPHEGISDEGEDQARDRVCNDVDHEKKGEESGDGQKPDHVQDCSKLPQEVPTTPRTLLTKV
jgi:hypothetical protein